MVFTIVRASETRSAANHEGKIEILQHGMDREPEVSAAKTRLGNCVTSLYCPGRKSGAVLTSTKSNRLVKRSVRRNLPIPASEKELKLGDLGR